MERPDSEGAAAELIRHAHETRAPLALVGGGTRAGLGKPVQAARTITSRALSGIVAYEPQEMVLTAKAGTPMSEIEAALAENRQRLVFEPMDHRALYGTKEDNAAEPTIGGVAATNASGPRRFQAGAARDSLLGLRFVNGRGEVVKAGGRVMKNVTGLDLPKVLAGSFGTLGLITEVTFKVTPVPETEATLVWHGLSDVDAVALLAKALATSTEPSGAAHIALDHLKARTLLRLEGFPASISERAQRLTEALAEHGRPETLDAAKSGAIWRDVRDARHFATTDGAHDEAVPLWRISVAPTDGPKAVAATGGRAVYDWQGGLVWLETEADHETVRAAVRSLGGHATLARAPDTMRSAVPVFHPQRAPLAALTRRLRESFDPVGILNPGRMG